MTPLTTNRPKWAEKEKSSQKMNWFGAVSILVDHQLFLFLSIHFNSEGVTVDVILATKEIIGVERTFQNILGQFLPQKSGLVLYPGRRDDPSLASDWKLDLWMQKTSAGAAVLVCFVNLLAPQKIDFPRVEPAYLYHPESQRYKFC